MVWAACAAAPDANDNDNDGTADRPVVEAPARVLYGRVHDTTDQNRGLDGARVLLGDAEVLSDATGAYRIEAPRNEGTLTIDATEDGWTLHVMHLPDHPGPLEMWAGLLPIDETNRALGIMAASSDIQSTVQPDRAYVVVQVSHVGGNGRLFGGANVSVFLNDAPAPNVYVLAWNEVLESCLPARVEDGPAVTDTGCDGLILVPDIDPDTPVRVVIDHPERTCARSKEQRLEGDASPEVEITILPVLGALNLTGVQCEPL